jgi:hypothetical protein
MTRRTVAVPLLPDEREALRKIADVLIPGGAGLPSASEADIVGDPLDRVLGVVPGLRQTLSDVAGRRGTASSVIEALRAQEQEVYERLIFALSGAYYIVPRVRRALGYPGVAPRPTPAASGEADYYLEDDVLQPVIDRGAIYRSVP